ncbi:glycosyltransferase family 2 protein [Patescibacteria group bacterium]
MKLSVIIPVFNEAGHISECLDSLINQTCKDFEIIVVDDGSTDDTKKQIDIFIKKDKRISMLSQKHKGPGAARNLAVKKAKGEILVFVDADMTFKNDFLKELTKPIIERRSKGTFTTEEMVENWDNFISKMWNYETTKSVSRKRLPKNHQKKAKVFRAILKSEFDRVNGFDLVGYNDDWTLSEKLGYMSTAADKAVMYHKNPDNFKKVFNQSRWIGGRQYKFGELGRVMALFRALFPIGLIVGVSRAITLKNVSYVQFKIIYDFGIVVGILKYWLGFGHAK